MVASMKSRRMLRFWVILVLHSLHYQNVVTSACRTNGCTIKKISTELVANCSYKSLRSVPKEIPQNLTILNLSCNKISKVTNTSFHHMPYLHTLLLSNNLVDHLEVESLQNLPNLTVLDLNYNSIDFTEQSLPRGLFRNLHFLQDLRLKFMDIDHENWTYPEDTFSDLTQVRSLHLDAPSRPVFGKGFAFMIHLEKLYLNTSAGGCKISDISNTTFNFFSELKLKFLNVAGCSLAIVETGAFKPLSQLDNLDIHYTAPFGLMSAFMSLEGLQGRNVTHIDMSKVALWSNTIKSVQRNQSLLITSEMTRFIVNICLSKLSIRSNNIAVLEYDAFLKEPFLSCIEFFDISGNFLNGEPLAVLLLSRYVHLKVLKVNVPLLSRIKEHNPVNMMNERKEKTLHYGPNNFTLHIPPSLRYLSVSGSGVHERYTENFNIILKDADNLKHMDASFSAFTTENSHVYGVENVNYLDLSGNDCQKIPLDYFHSFRSLETLILKRANLDPNLFSGEKAKVLFQILHTLRIVYLSSNGLHDIYDGIVEGLYELERIYLDNNKFDDHPFHLHPLSNIRYIDLSYNTISQFSPSSRNMLDMIVERNASKTLQINLLGNILSCGCGSLDFVAWVKDTHIHFVHIDKYLCINNQGQIMNLSAFTKLYMKHWRACIGRLWLTIAFSILFLCLSLFALSILISRYSMRLKCFFIRLVGVDIEKPERKDFLYDVFIYYSSKDDYRWACNVFRQKMEVERGLRMCIPDRDFGLGSCTAEEILEGINQSWKTVIYVTDVFLKDELCTFTLSSAVYASTTEMPNRIIVLYSSTIFDHALPPLLTQLLDGDNAFDLELFDNNGDADNNDNVNHNWRRVYRRIISWL